MEDLLKRGARASAVNTLQAGEHLVHVAKMIPTDDQHRTFDGAEAIAKEEWKDATPQIACVFNNAKGVFTHRFNVKGFKRFTDLTPDQQTKAFAAGREGYAVSSKTGLRVEDPERTDKCWRMIDDMCARAGMKEGEEIGNLVGKELVVVIAENDNGNLRITGTKKASALKAVAETVVDELD